MTAVTTVAQISDVRDALGSDTETPSGAVTDKQINASLDLAREIVTELIGESEYGFALRGLFITKKQKAIRRAEALFAVSRLPQVVRGATMSATGQRRTTTIGDAVTEFASAEEGQKERGGWESEAFRLLAPYLAHQIKDANGKTIGARSRSKNFSIASTD